jgi:non-specific protein-tyrosine kinase
MSKIERALRKAEDETRKKAMIEKPPEENEKVVLGKVVGIAEIGEAQPGHAHISESFRKIAAKLKACCENMGRSDAIFTSAVSGEGKTTNAVNCAVSLCQDFNLSVCLVDCDLRNPRIADHFPSNGTPGIVEVLKGDADIGSVIQSTCVHGLSVVCSQKAGRLSLPLLNTGGLSKLIHELKTRFDFVIVDSPPLLPVADTVVLSRNVSALILVIESGRTRRKHIEQIFEQIERDKVVGFIMNYKRGKVPESYSYKKYYDYGLENE